MRGEISSLVENFYFRNQTELLDPPPATAGDDVRGGLSDYLGFGEVFIIGSEPTAGRAFRPANGVLSGGNALPAVGDFRIQSGILFEGTV